MNKPNSLDQDFKKAFAAAKACGNTVMEGGEMEDYFQMSATEIHQHLANWAEFTVRCVNAEDFVGLEEVSQNMDNLHKIVTAASVRLTNLRKAMGDQLATKKLLKDAAFQTQRKCETLKELFQNELGMDIDTTE